MSSPSKRREMDLMKLMMSDYKVEMINDGMQEFFVDFNGPKESPYQGGVWRIRVELPDAYPYKSPSIGFVNKIYHPNVDEMSGSVCLDVINQTWSPMFGRPIHVSCKCRPDMIYVETKYISIPSYFVVFLSLWLLQH
ncbi:hypothetical protein ABKV19_012466 [Rosa sericea]